MKSLKLIYVFLFSISSLIALGNNVDYSKNYNSYWYNFKSVDKNKVFTSEFTVLGKGNNIVYKSKIVNDKTSTNDTLKSKLVEFEKIISSSFSINQNKIDWNDNSVYTKKNKYDRAGLQLLQAFYGLEEVISEKKNNPNAKLEDLETYIIKHKKLINAEQITFNEQEEILYNSFARSLEIGTINKGVEVAKKYEEFAIENFENQEDIKNFLIVVSIVKFTTYTISSKKTFTAWENCVVDCMGRKYNYYNAVDWIEFGINPGANILWNFASCGWSCY